MRLVELVLTLTFDLLSKKADSVTWCRAAHSLNVVCGHSQIFREAEGHEAFGQAFYQAE